MTLTLSACSEVPRLTVPPPANLTVRCPGLPPFDGATADDLMSAHLDLVGRYRECATRHNALADLL